MVWINITFCCSVDAATTKIACTSSRKQNMASAVQIKVTTVSGTAYVGSERMSMVLTIFIIIVDNNVVANRWCGKFLAAVEND